MMIFLVFLFAAVLLVLAIWIFYSSDRAALQILMSEHVQKELQNKSFAPAGHVGHAHQTTRLKRWFWRAGIELTPRLMVTAGGAAVLLALLAWQQGGWQMALLGIVLLLVLAILLPAIKSRRRAAAIGAQLPLFLDQIVRALGTGRSLDGAIHLASEEAREPLFELMSRVMQQVELGEDLGDALRDAAQLYEIQELHFIAMAVQIARRHGSSPREMLESVARLIRGREQSQRELRALTGETRISAWLLGLLPTAMALYMLAVNPNYLHSMWYDPSGRYILMMALGMQALGGFILWRMVKSV